VKETSVSEKVLVIQQWKGQVYVVTETRSFVYKVERVKGEYEQFLEEEVWICCLTSAFVPPTTMQFL
jgi:hypothetical protein